MAKAKKDLPEEAAQTPEEKTPEVTPSPAEAPQEAETRDEKEEKKEVDGHDFHTDGAHSNTSSGLGSAAESFFSASGLLLYLLRIDTRLSYKDLTTAPQEI